MTIPIKPAVKNSILALSLLAGLSACGGGGGGAGGGAGVGAQATRQSGDGVPASAAASNTAFVAYLNTLPTNETEEPLNAASVRPPTTDSDEPTNV